MLCSIAQFQNYLVVGFLADWAEPGACDGSQMDRFLRGFATGASLECRVRMPDIIFSPFIRTN